ncbi:hypothetical protein Q8A67_005633 [Cirrhinus molitorella]|uniref:Ig-like domain-containing protein n=1 Tax=Cirrhinus molitorella TaxID=172907 RepID=A0AA88Q6F2_9TELE|nr:hypothetical protein Q8A67_005633 [Cirrhinus molitorella]
MNRRCCFIWGLTLLIDAASLHQIVEGTKESTVILKCSHRSIDLEENQLTVHWRHNNTRNVFDIIRGKVSIEKQNPAYKNRSEVLTEELKKGNIFLRLTNLQHSDKGIYLCFVPVLGIHHSTQLVVKERSFITCTTAEIRSHGTGARPRGTLHFLIPSSGLIALYLDRLFW